MVAISVLHIIIVIVGSCGHTVLPHRVQKLRYLLLDDRIGCWADLGLLLWCRVWDAALALLLYSTLLYLVLLLLLSFYHSLLLVHPWEDATWLLLVHAVVGCDEVAWLHELLSGLGGSKWWEEEACFRWWIEVDHVHRLKGTR